MYKQCRTEQSSKRQHLLEQGLLKMMLTKHYDEISVSDLCSQQEIPRKAFYRYFSGKEGALHALIDHTLMDFAIYPFDKINDDGMWIQQTMEEAFSYWKSNKLLLDALLRSDLSGLLILRAVEYSRVEAATSQKFLAEDEKIVREHMTTFVVCGFMSMVVQWHQDGYPQSVQKMAQIMTRLIYRPLITNMTEHF